MIDLGTVRAVVFDVDGVLTDTASLHRRAWRETFDALFADIAPGKDVDTGPFTDDEYRRLVDGRHRADGARAVLAARNVTLADGADDDVPGAATVAGLASRKDARYRDLLDEFGPAPFPSSLELLARLRVARIRTAAVTASRHGAEVLRRAGIEGQFDAVVDGSAAAAMGLRGTPSPDTMLEAATRLGVAPRETLVIEDALAGVRAAVEGGFRVVAVDRHASTGELAAAGAEQVVADLADLGVVGEGPAGDSWLVADLDDAPARQATRESLFTLCNGYIGTRGAPAYATDDGVHYPGTYFAGVYDRLCGTAGDRPVEEEAIVNAPNWLTFSLSVEHGPWLGRGELAVSWLGSQLDLRRGLLELRYAVTDAAGRRTSVLERRLVSMADPHLAASQIHVVAVNWSGALDISLGLDGAVSDAETVEERLLGGHHLDLVTAHDLSPDGAELVVRTRQSHVVLVEALRCTVSGAPVGTYSRTSARVERTFHVAMRAGERVACEKVVAFYSSRDMAISEPAIAARDAARGAGTFSELLAAHEASWRQTWSVAALEIRDHDEMAQRLVNLHLFHVLQVASPHVVDRDVGLGARGLHGEGYLGHVFWDETFVFPTLTPRFPSLVRSLLAYRSRRLPAARSAARAAGHLGAKFPWQSGSDGRDETPVALFNPRSAHWLADHSHLQHHVGLAIAHNFWRYFQTTGDTRHLFDTGFEVMFEIARFFASTARLDTGIGRYRIERVMGPDEFHDGYPWRDEPGVDDNTYTNVLTSWLLERAIALVELARRSGRDDVVERVAVSDEELARFDEISRLLHVPFIGAVPAQFEGFERLEPIDLAAYRSRYGDIGRLDLILEAEGDDVRRYQATKQPDTLMLLYLLSAEELRGVLARLGYSLDGDAIRETVEYYSRRVCHGSSLSRIVHAWVTSRLDRAASWRYLHDALAADFADAGAGSTGEGIHLGAMAGTVDLLARCYTGLEARSDALWLNPRLPDELASLSFRVEYRGHLLSIEIDRRTIEIACPRGVAAPVTLILRATPYTVLPGDRIVHEYGA